MRTGDLLRRLDSRLLPPLARAMSRLAQGRLRMRVLTAVALISSSAVLLTAVWAADRGQPGGDPTVGEVVRVGVGDGQSIPRYVASSREELAQLVATPPSTADTYALVTLTQYLAPEQLAPVLGEVRVAQVFGRVPLPDAQTQIVHIPAVRIPGDVIDGMAQVATRKEAEAAEYRKLSGTMSGDGERERQMRQVYDSGAAVAAAEATAYRAGCHCVYAAVIRATPSAMEKVSARSEVRAVDPAPEVSRLDRAVFLPPLPEQEDVVRPPVDTALPSPDPSAPPTLAVQPAPTGSPAPPSPAVTSEAPASPAPTTPAPTETSPPASVPPPTEPAGTPTASQ
ncbi:hypothetical protein GCM10022251_12690 [Phytohabitans flavus]|uniref:Uncharacterized protein n=1 Tax=Phytohabitans flavus TaxID=1076124 RepID=A0A6F8XJC5_9ACTN|nr:hypothetical protein [Phytohabitans flavus]BCB73912.1 hypothetical protein Pflav_003220 [Phytohabitans flavus]